LFIDGEALKFSSFIAILFLLKKMAMCANKKYSCWWYLFQLSILLPNLLSGLF